MELSSSLFPTNTSSIFFFTIGLYRELNGVESVQNETHREIWKRSCASLFLFIEITARLFRFDSITIVTIYLV